MASLQSQRLVSSYGGMHPSGSRSSSLTIRIIINIITTGIRADYKFNPMKSLSHRISGIDTCPSSPGGCTGGSSPGANVVGNNEICSQSEPQVSGPTFPSTTKPKSFWYVFTEFLVCGPNFHQFFLDLVNHHIPNQSNMSAILLLYPFCRNLQSSRIRITIKLLWLIKMFSCVWLFLHE